MTEGPMTPEVSPLKKVPFLLLCWRRSRRHHGGEGEAQAGYFLRPHTGFLCLLPARLTRPEHLTHPALCTRQMHGFIRRRGRKAGTYCRSGVLAQPFSVCLSLTCGRAASRDGALKESSPALSPIDDGLVGLVLLGPG